jgi:lipopolysaccharide export system protein LptC
MFQRPWKMALAVAAVSLSLLLACNPSQRTEQTAVAPELKLERVRFRVWRGETLRARGEARQVTLRRDTGQLAAVEVRAELPARDEPVLITAPTAHGLLSSQAYEAEGGVVVTHGNDRAVTDRARWEPGPSGQGRVVGDDPVSVERGALTLDGTGFTFDPRTGDLQVGGPVRTRATGGAR